MNAAQIVQDVYSSLEQGKFDYVLSLLSEDFVFSGATPVPLNKHQWVGVIKGLRGAMPDFWFDYRLASVEGNSVIGSVEIVGTHTAELVLPLPGLPRVPATGRTIHLPHERVDLTVRNGQVTSLQVENLPNGGVPGILRQMGVALPTA